MNKALLSRLAAALVGTLAAFSILAPAGAAPMGIAMLGSARLDAATPPSLIEPVRARTRHRFARRNSGVPAVLLGIFGAVAGAAIASDRYNSYSSDSYGYPNGYGYGYDPGYVQRPAYGYYGGGYYGRGHRYGGYRGYRW